MALSHDEVVRRFAARKKNRQGLVEHSGANVYCRGNVLYSYGRHFPLAVYLAKDFFLKNGDRYSVSTSQHQSITQRHCEGPTVSFACLNSAMISPTSLVREDIICVRGDVRTWIDRYEGEYSLYGEPWTPPTQGMFVPTRENEDGSTRGFWHILGAVCIQKGDRYFLCSMDHDMYFVSELPMRPESVEDAFNMLKPPEVHDAEDEGIEVLRQGEWFFIPTDLTDRDITDMLGFKYPKEMRSRAEAGPLPLRANQENRHVCKHVDVILDVRTGLMANELYAKGMVRHLTSWGGSTGQHPALRLGDVWHLAVRNMEIQSWSSAVGGRFD